MAPEMLALRRSARGWEEGMGGERGGGRGHRHLRRLRGDRARERLVHHGRRTALRDVRGGVRGAAAVGRRGRGGRRLPRRARSKRSASRASGRPTRQPGSARGARTTNAASPRRAGGRTGAGSRRDRTRCSPCSGCDRAPVGSTYREDSSPGVAAPVAQASTRRRRSDRSASVGADARARSRYGRACSRLPARRIRSPTTASQR